jgi:hypothetical protein
MADEARPVRPLRVVPPAGAPAAPEPVTMADAIMELAGQVAALNPTLFMVVYEHPPGKLNTRTVPESAYVAEILASRAHDMLRQDIEAEN